MAFATTTDLEARIGTLDAGQSSRADALLDDATALIQEWTGQDIEAGTTTAVLRAPGTRIRLPQRPVTAVTTVVLLDEGTDRTVTGWAWDGLDQVDLAGATGPTTINAANPITYRVTYSHGHATVPTTIKALTCKIVSRVLNSPTLADGVVAENIGQYGYQMQQGTASMGSGVYLTEADKKLLRELGYRPAATTIRVTAA